MVSKKWMKTTSTAVYLTKHSCDKHLWLHYTATAVARICYKHFPKPFVLHTEAYSEVQCVLCARFEEELKAHQDHSLKILSSQP
jgi:hypothetical protein